MTATLPEAGLLARIGAEAAAEVRRTLVRAQHAGETLRDPADLKSSHASDAPAARIARQALAGLRCNIFIEGEAVAEAADAAFCAYVDPVDGSLNWDRGVGDPAFVLAVAPGPRARCLDDLAFAWVEGLRSGDRYWTDGGSAFHRAHLSGRRSRLRAAATTSVSAAVGYLRAGYGRAREQLARTLPLYLAARDLRAIDNAALEFCEIARGAADFMVEARGMSDGFNLLAWPLARSAGAVLRGLDGSDLARAAFRPDAPADYLLAANLTLADAVLERLGRFDAGDRQAFEALLGRNA